MGVVTLVGAGPGDASLITVKGLERLKTCDVVIYDRLASEELLAVTREDCIRVFVGKRPGAHSMKQEEMNRILVEYGKAYPNVVRLKGGDPFVFGRGGEEYEALRRAGISCEIVPGVTSAVAVPELAGIPVTHRGMAQSFHVITGHTASAGGRDAKKEGHAAKDADEEPDTLTGDYETLARSEGTLVFLMGLSNLKRIAERLIAHGKPADTPAAVISNGATSGQQVVRGVLSDLAARVGQAGLTSPAVIVIGETAALSFGPETACAAASGDESAMGSEPPGAPRMQTHNAASGDESAMGSEPPGAPRMQAHNAASGDESCRRETGVCVQSGGSAPLCGVVATERTTADFARAKPRDILCGVVATERTTADFARALSGRGGEAVPVFTMQTEQTEQTGRLRTELSGIEEYEWVLFFSKQAAVCFFEAAADTRTDLRRLAGVKFGVIGTGTEAVLKDHGIYADFMPEKADAEAFAEAFVRQYAKSRVLFPRAARGNPAPAKIMARAGCSVCEIPAYDMKGERGVRFPEWFTLRTFAFFSASGVQAFFEELSETKETLPAGSTCCCIGESTRDALKRELEERMSEDDAQTIRILVPEKTSVSGMAEEIARLW